MEMELAEARYYLEWLDERRSSEASAVRAANRRR